jgi:hypothetical protein
MIPEQRFKDRARAKRVILGMERDKLRQAFGQVIERYDKILPEEFPLPTSFSVERELSQDGTLIYGSAGRNRATLYSAGFAQARRRGESFEATAIHVYLHEQVHLLSHRATGGGMLYSDWEKFTPPAFRYDAYMSGLEVAVSVTHPLLGTPQQMHCHIFRLLNEGVTESLTREVMVAYHRSGGLSTLPNNPEKNFIEQATSKEATFYPECVRFVQKMISYFAVKINKPEDEVRSWLYRAYFSGSDLRSDNQWKNMCESCAPLPKDFTKRLAFATIRDFAEIEECYFDGKGVPDPFGRGDLVRSWDDLEIVPLDE